MYIIFNLKERRAIRFRDIYDRQGYEKLLNRVIVFDYPIQAGKLIEKYFGNDSNYAILKIKEKGGKRRWKEKS